MKGGSLTKVFGGRAKGGSLSVDRSRDEHTPGRIAPCAGVERKREPRETCKRGSPCGQNARGADPDGCLGNTAPDESGAIEPRGGQKGADKDKTKMRRNPDGSRIRGVGELYPMEEKRERTPHLISTVEVVKNGMSCISGYEKG